MDKLTEVFIRTRRGSYLTLGTSSGVFKGNLKSVDVKNGKLTIESTAYEHNIYNISIDQIGRINGICTLTLNDPDVNLSLATDRSGKPITDIDGHVFTTDFSQITGNTGWTGEAWLNPADSELGQESKSRISRIPPGTYLIITGLFDGTTMSTIRQGKLQSVDYGTNTITLDSDADPPQSVEVPMSKITKIDESRTSSGALSAAQAPGWRWFPTGWVRTDK